MPDKLPVIDDSNYTDAIEQGSRGYLGMWETRASYLAAGKFSDLGITLIPEREWDDIIRQQEKDKTTIRDLCMEMGLPPLNQQRTNYCWVNAPTHCCEIIRLMETGRVFSYSPASAGAPIKGFRNVGGWGSQALEFFKTSGLNDTNDWPANEINRRYYTDDNREKAKRNLVLEYFTLESWEERASCILAGIPTADGYDWWRHEVCGVGLVKKSHDLVIRNSWGAWGDGHGFATLSGRKKHAADSVAITAMLPL